MQKQIIDYNDNIVFYDDDLPRPSEWRRVGCIYKLYKSSDQSEMFYLDFSTANSMTTKVFVGIIHRIDGPAITTTMGEKFWYFLGQKLTKEEWFEKLTKEEKQKAIWNLDD